ncbi:hypothetical protein [Nocardia sp. NPDC050710]|uniref:hypothetical protein n=1 Tax=Nocardia sp. NPDC050710 TaxID=3157220 RepID=UPI0033C180E8
MTTHPAVDPAAFRELALAAIADEICDTSLLAMIDSGCTIDSGLVQTMSLLQTYTRRLRYTGGNTVLLHQTGQLVAFLRAYPNEWLSMVHVRSEDGRNRTLIADSEKPEILFWMRMLDLPRPDWK